MVPKRIPTDEVEALRRASDLLAAESERLNAEAAELEDMMEDAESDEAGDAIDGGDRDSDE